MSESVKGKSILVTGGAKRIGRSIALRLAAEGARVLIHYNGSEREARATAEECGGAPLFRANLESVAEIRKMFEQVGPLDGLVNNAARFTRIDPLKIEEADWDFIHSVNLKSVFFCCQAAARIMLSGRRRAYRQHQFAGGFEAVGGECPLLFVEGRSRDADAGSGQGVGSEDFGEQRCAWSDSVRGNG